MPLTAIFTARRNDVVVEDVSDELLIYDRRTDVAHCLSEVAALVWRTCERGATLGEIAEQISQRDLAGSGVDAAELANTAVAELVEKGLLETSGAAAAAGLVSRRQALRKMAGVGAAAIAGPLVVSAAVPTAAFAAASCSSASGTCGSETGYSCCTGYVCSSLTRGICETCDFAGNPCTSSSDCCSGYSCPSTGLCSSAPCYTSGFCGQTSACCYGYSCSSGRCMPLS